MWLSKKKRERERAGEERDEASLPIAIVSFPSPDRDRHIAYYGTYRPPVPTRLPAPAWPPFLPSPAPSTCAIRATTLTALHHHKTAPGRPPTPIPPIGPFIKSNGRHMPTFSDRACCLVCCPRLDSTSLPSPRKDCRLLPTSPPTPTTSRDSSPALGQFTSHHRHCFSPPPQSNAVGSRPQKPASLAPRRRIHAKKTPPCLRRTALSPESPPKSAAKIITPGQGEREHRNGCRFRFYTNFFIFVFPSTLPSSVR